ncbi:hypothetical protein [Achromobacter aloeverae]
MTAATNEAAMADAVARLRQAIGQLEERMGPRMTPAMRKALYERGYAFYESARYDEAYRLFVRLVLDDPGNTQGLRAAAAAAQAQGKYELALNFYTPWMMATDDPLPAARFAECLLKLGRVTLAREAIDIARSLCVNEEHGAVREYCASLECRAAGVESVF